jgi:integrase/recombinase XerD
MDLENELSNLDYFKHHLPIPFPLSPAQSKSFAQKSSPPVTEKHENSKKLINRSLEKDPRRKIIENVLYKFFSETLFGEKYVKIFLMDLYRRNCRPNTLRAYSTSFFLFTKFLKKNGHRQFETVIRNDIGEFIEHEQDREMAPNTVLSRVRCIMAFLRFLSDRSIINPDITKKGFHIKIPDSLPRAIDPDDLKKLMQSMIKPRDKAMFLLLLRTGMRIGELLSTRIPDINLKEKKINIYEAQKTRVGRVVYFGDDAAKALNKWLQIRNDKQEYIFYGQGGKPLSYERVRSIFIDHLQRAEIHDKDYTIHCLRHTFASELLNAGMRLECLQVLLGHKYIEMTRIYARLTDITRKSEYFKAMAFVEKGEGNGHYRCDY